MKTLIILLSLVSLSTFAAGGGHDTADKNSKAHRMESLFPPKQADTRRATTAAAPTLEAPKFMAQVGNSTTLKWAAQDGVRSYHVQVATDPNFKWLKVDQTMYGETTMEVKDLEQGKHYYWRVSALKPENDPSYLKGPYSKSMFSTGQDTH